GTLGVVTKATLRLVPKPEAKWTLLVAFEDDLRALEAVQTLLRSGIAPSILEFLDTNSVYCAEEIAGVRLFKEVSLKPLLLVELDGFASQLEIEKARALAWARELGLAHKEARSSEEADTLWSVRRACSG